MQEALCGSAPGTREARTIACDSGAHSILLSSLVLQVPVPAKRDAMLWTLGDSVVQ